MPKGLIQDVDCERNDWIVLRLCRLGDSKIRYVLTIQEISNGRNLMVTACRQLEGDHLVGGEVMVLEQPDARD